MANKDMKHWGYDLICSLCCLILFLLGMVDYDSFISFDGSGRGTSIGALMRLVDRSFGNREIPLGLLLIVSILFITNAYRKWRKSK